MTRHVDQPVVTAMAMIAPLYLAILAMPGTRPVSTSILTLLVFYGCQSLAHWLISTAAAWTNVDPLSAVLCAIAVLSIILGRNGGPARCGALDVADISSFVALGDLFCGAVFPVFYALTLQQVLGKVACTLLDLGALFYPDKNNPIEAWIGRSGNGFLVGLFCSTIKNLVYCFASLYLFDGPPQQMTILIADGARSLVRMLRSASPKPGQALPPCPCPALDMACLYLCRLLGVPYGRLGPYCFNLLAVYTLIASSMFFLPWEKTVWALEALGTNPWFPLVASLLIIEAFDGLQLGPPPEPWVPRPRLVRSLINYLVQTLTLAMLACSFGPIVKTLFEAAAAAGIPEMGELEPGPFGDKGPTGAADKWSLWAETLVCQMLAYRVLRDLASGMQESGLRLEELPHVSKNDRLRSA